MNIHHCTNIISFNFCIVGIIWSTCTYYWCSFLLHIQCINTLINILFIINNSSNTFENCRKKANKNNIKYTKCPLADILSLVRTWNNLSRSFVTHGLFFRGRCGHEHGKSSSGRMSHLIVHVDLLTLMGNEGTDFRSHGVLYCALGVLSFDDSKCCKKDSILKYFHFNTCILVDD